MERFKPASRIKTRQMLSRYESLKHRLRKPGCLFKDLLQGSSSGISSPPAGYPTAYGKFVKDKYRKAEKTQKRYLSVDDPVSKSLISRKVNL